MKTLTVEEAVAGLSRWVERALAGEQIQIRTGDRAEELRPTKTVQNTDLTPREALQS